MMPFYATIGSNQIDKALAFYSELLALIGWKKVVPNEMGGYFFGDPESMPDSGVFGVLKPFDGETASVGNGSLTGFMFDTNEAVDAFYEKALSLGATDEGAPGYRGPEAVGSYFAYFRDLDGNKISAACWKRNQVFADIIKDMSAE